METAERKTTISVMVPEKLDRKIEHLAITEVRSKSYYIRKALERYLEQYPDPIPPA